MVQYPSHDMNPGLPFKVHLRLRLDLNSNGLTNGVTVTIQLPVV